MTEKITPKTKTKKPTFAEKLDELEAKMTEIEAKLHQLENGGIKGIVEDLKTIKTFGYVVLACFVVQFILTLRLF